MRAASSRRTVGRALTRARADPRRGYWERRRRIGQVTAALSATILAIVVILQIVGGFASGVALPPAVVFNSPSSARTAAAPAPGSPSPNIPGAAIVNSVPKLIEGGESEDGSNGNGSSNKSVTTTSTPSNPSVSTSAPPPETVATTTTTAKQGSGGEDGGTYHRSGGSGGDGGSDGASGASGASGGNGGSGGSGDH